MKIKEVINESKEREDNLIDINVYGHGCMEGLYNCEGRFNTKHIFSDGFNPDSGWYRIADYRVNDLKVFMKKGINISKRQILRLPLNLTPLL